MSGSRGSNGGNPYADMDLLRFTTAGSVDDGKSTLIGRLLYDTKSIFEDQLEQIDQASKNSGEEGINLALLTDGLRAEREQKITIDVAYRYFATPRRKFIIADTPGHEQYTRNMVTGASTAELAIVLLDASRGITTQSKRHGFITSLLRLPHVVLAVNKMDLVGWSRDVYDKIIADYMEFADKLELNIKAIPISALKGDNLANPSEHMPWYEGGTLLHHLETVQVGGSRNMLDFRFPVQYVIRPNQTFRGYAGRIASGTISPGQEVVVLPSGRESRIKSIETFGGPLAEAAAPDSVVLTLENEIDIGRGDMIVRRQNLPSMGTRVDASVCWMAEEPLDLSKEYVLKHTSREAKAIVTEVLYRIDMNTLHRDPVQTLKLNEIGRIKVETASPLFFDSYRDNRATGSFILIDPHTNATVAAGMIRGEEKTIDTLVHGDASIEAPTQVSPDVVWQGWNVPRAEREARNGHKAAVVWLTGLPGSGKSTIAQIVERELFDEGMQTMLLDGDNVRHGLSVDLKFSERDRMENIRRVGEVARLFFEQGAIVICAFVSPFRRDRDRVRSLFPEGSFLEVFVDCPPEETARRDPKGLYKKAQAGAVSSFTGVSDGYEPPNSAEMVVKTGQGDRPEDSARRVLDEVRRAVRIGTK
jgi:bifunctional enzyme CysN/CysC